MPVNENKRCMGCMLPLTEDGACPRCGYDSSKAQLHIDYLAPGFLLGGRYLVGKMTSCDTEGAWYVGLDEHTNERVWVREYAPKAIMLRDYDTGMMQPLPGSEAQYKALMSDFEDLCGAIRRLSANERVLPVLDIVRANSTVYAVYRYIKMISLESFFKRSGGKLSWRHTKKLLMPLFHTVAGVHNAGLIHRGLSPRTVEVDQNGTLWLTCFSIAAARTNKSELTAQLYQGYAAPEQYSLNSWQGTWSDVYALGAITYRALTGEDPPSAQDRVYGDDLLERTASSDLSDSVVSAINRALAVEVEDRTRTAEAYIADLLANEGSNTAVYTAPMPRRTAQEPVEVVPPPVEQRKGYYDGISFMGPAADEDEIEEQRRQLKEKRKQRQKDNKQKRKKKRRVHPAILLILSAIVATWLLGAAVYWFANTYLADLIDSVSYSSSEASMQQGMTFSQDEGEVDNGKVANFIGATWESIQDNAALDLTYQFVTHEGRSEEYEKGVVYEQSPKPGEALMKDGKTRVTLYVSEGAKLVKMPEVVGRPLAEVQKELEELKIPYQPIKIVGEDYKVDVVAKCNKNPGDEIDITRAEKVLIYVRMEGDVSSSDGTSSDEEESSEPSTVSSRPRPSSSSKASSSRIASSSRRSSSSKASSYEGNLKPR